MKLRTLMLCTAVGTLFLAGPLAAAPSDPYNTNPTPQERAQTDQLNSAAANRAHGDADADAAARANHDADVDSFNRDNDRANADRARYENDRARYARDRDGYEARNGNDARRWDAFFGYSRFRDVTAMQSRDLMGLRVSTRDGGRIGVIADVDANRYGRITRVAIRIGGGNMAWVDTNDLRFDPRTRVVYTTLSRDDVGGMAHMGNPRF